MLIRALARLERWLLQTMWGEAKPRALLNMCLWVLLTNCLAFYALPGAPYDTNANLWASAGLALGLLAARFERGFAPAVHLMLASVWSLLFYIAVGTGSINSPVLVWMTVLPLPALMLLGRAEGFLWLAWVLMGYGVLYGGALVAWWPAQLGAAQGHLAWVGLNQSLCVLSLMLLIRMYERLHVRQLDAIDARNQELKVIHLALERAQTHKEEFVAAVGHELRTPMNAILGLNGVLRDQVLDRSDDVEVVDHIRRSTQHLLGVVNNILDYSQLQAGHLMLQPEWMDLRSTLGAVADTYQDKVRARAQTLTCEVEESLPEQIWIDRRRFSQLLGNLLDNALKRTPDEGTLKVRLGSLGKCLRGDVLHSGSALPPGAVNPVSDGFPERGVEADAGLSGDGLGLSICRQLVQIQSGRMGVETLPAGGANFWFELPIQEPTEVDIAALAQQPKMGPATPLEILLVDDDAVNLMVARLQLAKSWPAARVTTATSAREALDLLGMNRYDIAIIDMIMPDISGVELVRLMRRHHRVDVASTPVLGLTASNHPDDWARCRAAGMDAVVVKPMDPVEVLKAIRRHVRRDGSAVA